MTSRRTYTAEFKREAVRLSQQPGVSVVQIAEELGVSDHSLYKWRKQAQERGGLAFPGNGKIAITAEQEENLRLKKELERVKQERDILKKAVVGVARSSYYHWRARQQREPSEREKCNAELLEKVKTVFEKNKGRYGSPRVHAELKKQQITCSLGRVKRLMRREGLYAVSCKKYRTKQERCDLETRNLLLEQPRPSAINQVWHVDITYIATAEGWLYLAGVMDACSKRIVGYAMADNMKTDLVLQALRSATTRRKPPPGLIHHSDRGSQYTSYAYQRELETHKMLPSFTGKGACFDNAAIESFWSTLKRELVYPIERFATRDDARVAVFEYIEVYIQP